MTRMLKITLASRVKLSEDVLMQELQGEAVLLHLQTGVYFGLDQVGTRIWVLLGEKKVIGDAVEAMTAEFDVSMERCAEDTLALVSKLQEQGLLEIE